MAKPRAVTQRVGGASDPVLAEWGADRMRKRLAMLLDRCLPTRPTLPTLPACPCTPAACTQLEDESGPCALQPCYAAAGMSKDGIQELLETYCDAAVQEYVDKHVKPRYQVCQLYCFCVLALLLRGPRSSQCVQRLHQTCSDSSQPAAVVSLPSLGTRGPVQYTRRICRLTLTSTT